MREGVRTIFCGMCMGAADIVPGVSGGTIAYIMGFYPKLLTSIKSLTFKGFFYQPSTQFLFYLISGIALSFILLVPLFDQILNHEIYRSWLYSGFLGLILGSILLLLKQIQNWRWSDFLALFCGSLLAFVLTSLDLKPIETSPLIDVSLSALKMDPWLIFCGSIAVCALLLPGISGSYLLTILGCYSLVIGALADFIESAKQLIWDMEAAMILANLSLGIVLGALAFSRVVLWLLKHYHHLTIALMTGFMIGALPAVWPFWSYTYLLNPLKPHKGPLLNPDFPLIPSFDSSLIIPFSLIISGFVFVVFIDYLARKSVPVP